jgi:hypothetical protein
MLKVKSKVKAVSNQHDKLAYRGRWARRVEGELHAV